MIDQYSIDVLDDVRSFLLDILQDYDICDEVTAYLRNLHDNVDDKIYDLEDELEGEQ